MTQKHATTATQEGCRDNSVNVLERPNQRGDLTPIRHLWRDLKMSAHPQFPSILKETVCPKESRNPFGPRRAKLAASYPRRLKAVIAAKCVFCCCGVFFFYFNTRLEHNKSNKKRNSLKPLQMLCKLLDNINGQWLIPGLEENGSLIS